MLAYRICHWQPQSKLREFGLSCWICANAEKYQYFLEIDKRKRINTIRARNVKICLLLPISARFSGISQILPLSKALKKSRNIVNIANNESQTTWIPEDQKKFSLIYFRCIFPHCLIENGTLLTSILCILTAASLNPRRISSEVSSESSPWCAVFIEIFVHADLWTFCLIIRRCALSWSWK